MGGEALPLNSGPPRSRLHPDYSGRLDPLGPRVRAWLALGADPWVTSTMTRGYRIQFMRKPPLTRIPTFTSVTDPQHARVLREELSSLLEKRAIREVSWDHPRTGFYSRYFLVPKKDGGLRPILDLRGLNRYLRQLPCKMLTVPRVRQVVNSGDWFATIDLKDAYFQIPIWKGHWKFLRFGFEGRIYEFQVLPFGIALAPRTFTPLNGCSSVSAEGEGSPDFQLSGRLAGVCGGTVSLSCVPTGAAHSAAGSSAEPQEEQAPAITCDHIPRHDAGLRVMQHCADSREAADFSDLPQPVQASSHCQLGPLSPAYGADGCHGAGGATGSPAYATCPEVITQSRSESSVATPKQGGCVQGSFQGLSMVARPCSHSEGKCSWTRGPPPTGFYRCIPERLGCSAQRHGSARSLGRPLAGEAHKPLGAQGSPHCPTPFSSEAEGSPRDCTDRQ